MIKIAKSFLFIIYNLCFINLIPVLGDDYIYYLFPFMAGSICLALTLLSMNNQINTSFPILIVIAVFVFAYYVRFSFVAANPSLVYFLVPVAARSTFDDPSILRSSYYYLTVSFITFCISVIAFRIFLVRNHIYKLKLSKKNIVSKAPTYWFIVISLLLYLMLNAIYFSRGIGKMGTFVENPLPFKLTGAVIYLKSIIVPFFVILCSYYAKKTNNNRLAVLGVFVIILSGLFDMFVFESRGLFLVQLVTVGIVWVLAGFRINKHAVIAIFLLMAGYLFSVPIVVALRMKIPIESLSFSQIVDGLNFVFFRVTGIDQFMVIFNLGEPIPIEKLFDVLLSPRGVAGYYTTELLGYDDSIPQTFAPSFLGYLYLFGGLPAIIFGSTVLGLLVTYVWCQLDYIFPKTSAVIKSYFIIQVGFSITEGLSKTAFTSFMIVFLCAWYMEKTFVFKSNNDLLRELNA